MSGYCPTYKEMGLCEKYPELFGDKYCPATCKCEEAETCPYEDMSSWCPTYKEKGWCTQYPELFGEKYCPATCNC